MGPNRKPSHAIIARDAEPDELPWNARIFARIDSGVDGTLIAEHVPLTPTERLERMQHCCPQSTPFAPLMPTELRTILDAASFNGAV